MKEYRYHGYRFRATDTTTDIYVSNGRGGYRHKIVPLYEIDELKPRGKRPFLTSVEMCKDYIAENGVKD